MAGRASAGLQFASLSAAGADAATVWSELSANVATLTGLDGRLLPADGVQVDGAAFAAHKFPEGKLLKFAPVVLA